MKKCVVLLIVIGAILLLLEQCREYKEKHCYDNVELHSKLVKEVIEDLKDSACYKERGVYKRIYRRYNYGYADSTIGYYRTDNLHGVKYATVLKGDTVFMEFTDYTDYPRREE